MKHARRTVRVGGLTVGLAIGATVAAAQWVASADPLPPFDPFNFAISIDGITLFQEGTAHATSGVGDFAFADGAFSDAVATGSGNFAFADGFNSEADTALGNFDAATAVGNHSFADASEGNNDVASVYDFTGGPGSQAVATSGSGDFATVYDFFGSLGSRADAIGSHDIAAVFADGGTAHAGMGSFDLAAVFANDLTADALGNGIITIEPWF